MVFALYALLILLTAVYAMFLLRMRQGLRFLASNAGAAVSQRDGGKDHPHVTVVVPMRNEFHSVPSLLSSLRMQEYPRDRMEVFIVDDHSEDETAEEVLRNIEGWEGFRLLPLPESAMGKKDAISFAVQQARGEIIITTDGDCLHSRNWLARMTEPFADGADVVAGPVVYADRSTLFKRLQALEFLGLVGVGAGFFGIGYPRLCNGANFAYRKESFMAAGGYEGNAGIHSGDDEFLLRSIVYRLGGQARFVSDPDAVVTAPPEPALRGFLRQRIRWASKGRHNEDPRFVSFLSLLFIYFFFLAGLPLMVALAPVSFPVAVLLLLVKMALDLSVLLPAAALLRQPVRIPDVCIAEFLHPFYLVFVSVIGSIGAFTWKDRRLKNH
jgi:biofilm PGA synthesis N-glycosyltransferase PgaC